MSNIILLKVELCRSTLLNRARTGIANAFMGVACLVSGPIQGALLSTKFLWLRPVAFSGVSRTDFYWQLKNDPVV